MTREDAIKVLQREKDYVQQAIQKATDGDGYVSPDGLIRADDYVAACTEAISALRQQENVTNRSEPLALDELRSAYKIGCPVWLVGMEDGDGWVFIHYVDSCSVRYARIGTSEEWCFRTKSYGVRVWAYRQKPEEDDHA